jgi:hypothetical protein
MFDPLLLSNRFLQIGAALDGMSVVLRGWSALTLARMS